MSDSVFASFPLSPIERQIRNHALLCSIGFLVFLPIGAIVARLLRTFTNKWIYIHLVFQVLLAGPLIASGWCLGHKTASDLWSPHFRDTHQRVGLILLAMYGAQLVLGFVIHFSRRPSFLNGRRPPQNYVHAALGIATVALAAYQVHTGLYFEWDWDTGSLHPIPRTAKHAWLILLIVWSVAYLAGFAFMPRQHKQESLIRRGPRIQSDKESLRENTSAHNLDEWQPPSKQADAISMTSTTTLLRPQVEWEGSSLAETVSVEEKVQVHPNCDSVSHAI